MVKKKKDEEILGINPDRAISPIKKKKKDNNKPYPGKLIRGQRADLVAHIAPCLHPNLVPIEVAFIRITHPNGYKEQPKCEFHIGISLATAFRVRKFYCPACKEIIKAPSIYAEENI